jgi:hypothetical protein
VEKNEKIPPAVSTTRCPTRGATPFFGKPRISNTNTRIGCQRNKSRTLKKQIELLLLLYLLLFLYY